jgi:hypothetical protein
MDNKSTIGDVLNRLYRTYLYPPDSQPITSFLTSALVAEEGLSTLTLGGFAVPEDENLLRIGSILEANTELMAVRVFNETTQEITVQRGIYGTIPQVHAIDSPVVMNTPYPRSSALEYVADNIMQLYPRLYTVTAENLVEVTNGVAGIGDDLAVEVLSVWEGDFDRGPNVDAKIVDYHPAVGGRALLSNIPMGNLWVRYRRRMANVVSETQTLESIGMDARWVGIVMVGVAADFFAGRDLPASQVEWVSAVLEAENIEVGTRAQLSVGLARYRELLLTRAEAEMNAEYKVKTHMSDAISVQVRSAFG